MVVNCENTGTARTLGKCQTDVLVSMLPKETQVDMTDNRATCETFCNTMNGCKDTSLNHKIQNVDLMDFS